MDNAARIADLKRRIERDPASIAFAQLAEEYRRAGEYHEAVRVSRAGLARYPDYLSARVTLGRALMALGQLDAAQAELDQVHKAAPDNLSAARALADLEKRRGGPAAPAEPSAAIPTTFTSGTSSALAPPVIETPPAPPMPAVAAPDTSTGATPSPTATPNEPALQGSEPVDPVLADLEAWLAAIVADRAHRHASRAL